MQLSGLTQPSHQQIQLSKPCQKKVLPMPPQRPLGAIAMAVRDPIQRTNHIYYKMDMYIFVMYWTIIIHTVHLQLNPTMFIFLFCADQMWSSSTNFFSPIMYIYIYLHFHVNVWSLFMEGTITNNKKAIP